MVSIKSLLHMSQSCKYLKFVFNKALIRFFISIFSPLYNEEVKIFVRADSELDSIISMTMTRHGNTEIHQRYCNFTTTCSFNITMRRDMMPKSKVIVYYVKERKKIFQGETTIKTKELSGNYVSI